ncbi:substrate-binding domain-containing protein (plasmid) [Deinococcus radiomollis]|uniref:substrate-binding domain-containing protein n=1 Tax=Deinococcus radiomollis TaxID=468916 RepID=UPI003891F6D9
MVVPAHPMSGLSCQVRARRELLRLRSGELAARCGITRQALHSVETGAYVPNTLTALRLARALDCRVEDLFSLPEAPGSGRQVRAAVLEVGPASPPSPAGTRVQLVQVNPSGGNGVASGSVSAGAPGEAPWLAIPLSGQAGWGQVADGALRGPPAHDGRADVELFSDLALARRSAVLVGCDPSLGLVATHVARHAHDVRLLWRPGSSLQALRSLARGEAHAAGIHLWEASTGVSNLGAVERELPGQKAHLYTLWEWEQGLMVARGNPLGLRGPEGLLTPGLRLCNREVGAGSRALLDAWLAALGVTQAARRKLPGYRTEVPSHLEAAGRVADGSADAAPGPRSAAQALGLDFVPVQRERFDLVVPGAHLEHPAIQALIAVARQAPFRAELSALGGYDPAHAGELWQSTA